MAEGNAAEAAEPSITACCSGEEEAGADAASASSEAGADAASASSSRPDADHASVTAGSSGAEGEAEVQSSECEVPALQVSDEAAAAAAAPSEDASRGLLRFSGYAGWKGLSII